MKNDTAYAFKYGIDIAKNVFQLFRVDQEYGEVRNFKLTRKDLKPKLPGLSRSNLL